jgi:hypothetical protein
MRIYMPEITNARHVTDYRLELVFDDGTRGVVDLEGELYGPVFEPLQEPSYFAGFKLGFNTITWPNGADFSPEFLYAMVKGWVSNGAAFAQCRLPHGHEGPCELR